MLPDTSALLESLPSHAAVLDTGGSVVAANAAYRNLLHAIDANAPLAASFAAFCAKGIPETAADAVRRGLTAVLAGTESHFDIDLPCGPPQSPVWHNLSLTRVDGPVPGVLVLLTDITRKKQLEEHILHDAFHDTLTGLFNRALFLNRLDQAIKHLKDDPEALYAVLYLDIDRFKLVNKTFGHGASLRSIGFRRPIGRLR